MLRFVMSETGPRSKATGWVTAVAAVAGLAAGLGTVAAKGERPALEMTIFSSDSLGGVGGWDYGGYWEELAYEYGYDFPPPVAAKPVAVVSHGRQIELKKGRNQLTLPSVSELLDVGSVRLASVTDPTGTVVKELRFAPGGGDVTAMLRRSLGSRVVVETVDGKQHGILRAIDNESVIIDTEKGETPLLLLDRRTAVRGLALAHAVHGGGSADGLRAVVHAAQPGLHDLRLSYRTEGLTWTADYVVSYDESRRAADVTARLTVKNATSTNFANAAVTVAVGTLTSAAPIPMHPGPYGTLPPTPVTPIQRFPLGGRIDIGAQSSTQVPLFEDRQRVAARRLAVFEATPPFDARFMVYPNTDCYSENLSGSAKWYVEIDRAALGAEVLPPGIVRTIDKSRKDDGVLAETPIFVNDKTVRASFAAEAPVVGKRHAVDCRVDERARTMRERIEITLTNSTSAALETVVREYMTRWSTWQIEGKDAGSAPIDGGREFRVTVPAKGAKVVSYTVVYRW